MRKRKLGKIGKDGLKQISFKEIECSKCGRVEEVDSECESVICWECVSKMCPVDPSKLTQKKQPTMTTVTEDGQTVTVSTSKRPRGWRFMKEFIDADGTVYHDGIEIPELKGTLPPTDVVAIKAAQKVKSKDNKAHRAEREAKKEAKLLKEFEKKKKWKEKEEKRRAKELQQIVDSSN